MPDSSLAFPFWQRERRGVRILGGALGVAFRGAVAVGGRHLEVVEWENATAGEELVGGEQCRGRERGRFLPTIQNSNSGDAVGDGDDLPDSAPLSGGGGGSASTASAIAASATTARRHRPTAALLGSGGVDLGATPRHPVEAAAASGNGEWISGSQQDAMGSQGHMAQ